MTASTKARIPTATYRLQLHRGFTFTDAAEIVGYLHELGVSDLYLSPILTARPGSLHGYDVVRHDAVNPELGGEAGLETLLQRLEEQGMGVLLDIVPNHMNIGGAHNRWWNDVLENGPSSPYARYFDVDWNPPKADLVAKVLLPVLGDQYGRVLERKDIQITYDQGAFRATYYDWAFPVAPRTMIYVLGPVAAELRTRLGEDHSDVFELESIMTAIRHLPRRTDTDPEHVGERRREKEVIKRRIAALLESNAEARTALERALADLNGRPGDPRSFDRLEAMLGDQGYRLSFWRVAADEINYRRFFDINDLAAIRVEEPEVFAAVHEVAFRLIERGGVTGLRIDHIDGLREPLRYLEGLQRRASAALQLLHAHRPDRLPEAPDDERRPLYVVAEKILGAEEPLPEDWPVHGTTGYDFLNRMGGVFVERASARRLRDLYQEFTGQGERFRDIAYQSKKLILRASMSSELTVLARKLDRVSEQHRYTRDFTLNSLQAALAELIACFPVYRIYAGAESASPSAVERQHIETAVRDAKRRNPVVSASIFDFLRQLLLGEEPEGLSEEQRAERRDFVLRFQQLSSPVTAKGLEDTAFYRYFPLASLNEVGGEPDRFGISVGEFHRYCQDRLRAWPHGLSATTTHDTKRAEDVRARLHVLSEVCDEWAEAVGRWRELNRGHKSDVGGLDIPDAAEEYLLYQTLVGTLDAGSPAPWADAEGHRRYVGRIQEYMNKALKEAKVHTSWVNPDEEHDRAVQRFIEAVLTPGADNRFLVDLGAFVRRVAHAGFYNAIAQVLIKSTAPGVPDFYQGTELWDFSLVDPDNRRPVDYGLRRRLLESLRRVPEGELGGLAEHLMARPEDGRLKLLVTSRALDFRRRARELFERGRYRPLQVMGQRAHHVVAFERQLDGREVVVLAGRLFVGLGVPERPPLGPEVWGDTEVEPDDVRGRVTYRDVLTGHMVTTRESGALRLGDALVHLPVALLERM